MENLKKCPHCGEMIAEVAKKCKFCGEWVNEENKVEVQNPTKDMPKNQSAEQMNGFGYFLYCVKNYAKFEGRARRKEYWMFALFMFLFLLVLSLIDLAFGVYSEEAGMGLLSGIFTLATAIPSLAVSARRLHDIGKSAWFLLLSLIPLIGSIILLVWTLKDSEPGDNKWGPNPKAGIYG